MIKNKTQFEKTKSLLKKFTKEINNLEDQYSGRELEMMKISIIHQIEDLEKAIEEYNQITNLPFEEVVNVTLGKPVLLDNIATLLSKLRIAAGLTQEELSNLLDWKQPNLSRFESEKYYSQTLKRIIEYSGSLGIFLHVVPSLTEQPKESVNIIEINRESKNDLRNLFFGLGHLSSGDSDSPLPKSKKAQVNESWNVFSEEEKYVERI